MDIFPIMPEVGDYGSAIDRGVNFLYDFNKGDFVIKDGRFIQLNGDAGVVFWIEKTLRTEYEISGVYAYTEYGTKLDELRGIILPKEVEKVALEGNVKEALLQHERISSVTLVEYKRESDYAKARFEIELLPLDDMEEEFDYTSEQGFTRLTTLEEIKDFIGINVTGDNSFIINTLTL